MERNASSEVVLAFSVVTRKRCGPFGQCRLGLGSRIASLTVMSNYMQRLEVRLRGLVEGRRERALLSPFTVVASTVMGLALIAAPVALTRRPADDLIAGRTPITAAGGAGSSAGDVLPGAVGASAPATPPVEPAHKTLVVAFYGGWGDEGFHSLERNIDKIDVLMPMWYHIGNDGRLTLSSVKDKRRVMRLVRRENPDLKVMPIVNNYDKRTGSWNPEQVARLMHKKGKKQAIAKRIVATMRAEGYAGMNIDLEGFTGRDRALVTGFMKELYPRAHKAGLTVSQDVIVGSAAYDHAKLARYNDYMIPMMYDEHWKTSGPGPIASQRWYEKTLRKFIRQVPAEKVIVGLGTYAYNWGPGQRAQAMTFHEAGSLARRKHVKIKLDRRGMNSHFSYKQGGKTRHVWMLDAVSSYNQVKAGSEHKIAGYAFWRIGAEDPDVWKVFSDRDALDGRTAASLEHGRRRIAYDESSGRIGGAVIVP